MAIINFPRRRGTDAAEIRHLTLAAQHLAQVGESQEAQAALAATAARIRELTTPEPRPPAVSARMRPLGRVLPFVVLRQALAAA